MSKVSQLHSEDDSTGLVKAILILAGLENEIPGLRLGGSHCLPKLS